MSFREVQIGPCRLSVIGDDDQTVGQTVLDWAESRNVPTIAFASPWKPWPGNWRNLIAWDKGGAVGGGGDVTTCLKRSWELIQTARTGPLLSGRAESVVRFPMVPADTSDHICAKPVPPMKGWCSGHGISSVVNYRSRNPRHSCSVN